MPISEIPPFYFTYAACPKNEWDRNAISRINDALKKIRRTRNFRMGGLSESYNGKSLEYILKLYDAHLTHTD